MRRKNDGRATMIQSKISFGALALSCSTLLAACTGVLGGDDKDSEGSGPNGGKNGVSDGTAEDGDSPLGPSGYPDLLNVSGPYSPLAQLTSDEYVTALAQLLDVSKASVEQSPSREALAPDPEAEGLVNAANRQRVTQFSISGYATLTRAIAEEVLAGVNLQGYLDLLACDELGGSTADYSPEMCTRDYGEQLMRRAYRGAFNDTDVEQLDALMTGIDELIAGGDFTQIEALKRRFTSVVELIGLSPKFVLMIEQGDEEPDSEARLLTQQEIANRFAFLLTGGPADEALLQMSEGMDLRSVEGRLALADELLTGNNVAGSVDVLVRWFNIDDRADEASIVKLRAFLQDWIAESRPFSDLYSAPFPVDYADGTEVEEPFGVLGSKAVIASNSSSPTPSFINRGEFVTARLLCAQLPEDLPDAALQEDTPTAREVFEIHNANPCATCHHIFDEYGAALQRFDLDTNLYDPNDDYLGNLFELSPIGDVSGSVSDPAELGAIMGASVQAQTCMTKLWYRYAIRRDLLSKGYDDDDVLRIADEWTTNSDTSLRSLLRIIVSDENFARLLP